MPTQLHAEELEHRVLRIERRLGIVPVRRSTGRSRNAAAELERRISNLESVVGRPERKNATLKQVRRDFIEVVNRDGRIDYLDFWRKSGYPYRLVEKVLAGFVEKGQLEVED